MEPNHPLEDSLNLSWDEVDCLLAGQYTAVEEAQLRTRVGAMTWTQIEVLRQEVKSTATRERDIERLLHLFYRRVELTAANVAANTKRPWLGTKLGRTIVGARRSRAGLWSGISVLAAGVGLVAFAMFGVFWKRPVGTSSSRVYTTAIGQRAVVTLVDGSRVTLAPQTTLIVAPNFGRDGRIVMLTGEALFEVAPRTGASFVVRTGQLTTRVLGTTFDVRHYAEDREMRVAVTHGKVVVTGMSMPRAALSSAERISMVLIAGTVGRVTDSTALVTAITDVEDYTQWTQELLAFRRTPVPDVLATLGHWYGLEFRLADSTLATQHITATFDRRSAAEVLAALKVLLNASMTFESPNVVTLHAERTARISAPIRREIQMHSFTHMEVGR